MSSVGVACAGGPRRHPLHSPDATWPETSCYVDAWVELLRHLGAAPEPALAFCLASGFDGPNWRFLKPPPGDLADLYGIEVVELDVWRPVLDHVVDQLGRGRVCTVEVDAHWLPDTVGVGYRSAHSKTTIVAVEVDPAARRTVYLHGSGEAVAEGDDHDGIWRPGPLPPYTEVVLADVADLAPVDLTERAVRLARRHLAARREGDVDRLAAQVAADLPWLQAAGDEVFHRYAFATCRQMGAAASLAAACCTWLAGRPDGPALGPAATRLAGAADAAKAAQFAMARAARRGRGDLAGPFGAVADAWEAGLALADRALSA